MTRQMAMVGFLQAQNCTNLPSSWRHPLSRDDSMSADYYQEIARILEAGKFHMAFFDDRLAMPDRYGSDFANTCAARVRSYHTVDGRYARRLGAWEFAVAGLNLLDEHYFSNAFGCRSGIYPSSGRQLKASVRYDF